MPLDIILFSFTFAAGIIAFLNLCGVIMLPAYISNYMEKSLQLQSGTTTGNHNSKFSSRKLA
jgi:cytochrome c biogenesis protein CcdA